MLNDTQDPVLKTARQAVQMPTQQVPLEAPAPELTAPVPAGGNATLVAPNAAPTAPVVTPQIQAEAKTVLHESKLGKLAGFLLGGRKEYSADPATGEVKETFVKNKPGDLFRSILAGALLGGMAGAKEKEGDFWTGMGAGGTAVAEDEDKREKDRRTLAAKNAEMQQTAQRTQMEKQRLTLEEQRFAQDKIQFSASLAHMTKQELLAERDANLRELEFNAKENESSNRMFEWMHTAGASQARDIPENGVSGNGSKLQEMAVKNPEILRAPSGYERVIQKKIDFTDLKHSLKDGYTDKDGKPVDLATHTTWTVWDVPISAAKQIVTVDNKTASKMFPSILGGGVLPKDGSRPYTIQELSDLRIKQSSMNIAAEEMKRKERHDMATTARLMLDQERKGLEDRMKAAKDISGVIPVDKQKQFDTEFKKLSDRNIAILSGIEPEYRKWFAPFEQPATPPISYSISKVQEAVSKQIGWTEIKAQNLVVMVDPKTGVWSAYPAAQEATALRSGQMPIPAPGEKEVPQPPASKTIKASER